MSTCNKPAKIFRMHESVSDFFEKVYWHNHHESSPRLWIPVGKSLWINYVTLTA